MDGNKGERTFALESEKIGKGFPCMGDLGGCGN